MADINRRMSRVGTEKTQPNTRKKRMSKVTRFYATITALDDDEEEDEEEDETDDKKALTTHKGYSQWTVCMYVCM